MLQAAQKAVQHTAAQQAEHESTRRYLLAVTNRNLMKGRFNELSAIELLDIVTATSLEGGLLTYEEYRAQLELVEKNAIPG